MFAKQLNIPHFRGVFMRDQLPTRPSHRECAVINLDKSTGPGTHYVAYVKRGNEVWYFDSYGNLSPPAELIHYLGRSAAIFYNRTRVQKFNTQMCGRLSLQFLYNMTIDKFYPHCIRDVWHSKNIYRTRRRAGNNTLL